MVWASHWDRCVDMSQLKNTGCSFRRLGLSPSMAAHNHQGHQVLICPFLNWEMLHIHHCDPRCSTNIHTDKTPPPNSNTLNTEPSANELLRNTLAYGWKCKLSQWAKRGLINVENHEHHWRARKCTLKRCGSIFFISTFYKDIWQ